MFTGGTDTRDFHSGVLRFTDFKVHKIENNSNTICMRWDDTEQYINKKKKILNLSIPYRGRTRFSNFTLFFYFIFIYFFKKSIGFSEHVRVETGDPWRLYLTQAFINVKIRYVYGWT